LIEILGKHSISVKELKFLFSIVKVQTKNIKSSILPFLLKCLQKMSHSDPQTYFDFDGVDSGLKLPDIQKFPNKSYSISLWIRIEKFKNNFSHFSPRLFSKN
jgi:hypothetical protein